MEYILNDHTVSVEWTIYRGESKVKEDFSRAGLYVFLLGENDCRHLVGGVTVEEDVLKIAIPSGLPNGVYGVKAVWFKYPPNPLERPPVIDMCEHFKGNGRDRITIARLDCLFGITDNPAKGSADLSKIRPKSHVATFGYDGLNAYELAVLRGLTTKTEKEWVRDLGEQVVEDAYAGFANSVTNITDLQNCTMSIGRGKKHAVTNTVSGRYFWLILPAWVDLNMVCSCGVEIPMRDGYASGQYKVYRSEHKFLEGEVKFTVY